jgi:hypothetical protein
MPADAVSGDRRIGAMVRVADAVAHSNGNFAGARPADTGAGGNRRPTGGFFR